MNKKDSHTITFMNVEMEVGGYYYQGYAGTWEQPPEPREFEIEFISICGQDITELINEDYISDIEEQVLDEYY